MMVQVSFHIFDTSSIHAMCRDESSKYDLAVHLCSSKLVVAKGSKHCTEGHCFDF